MRKMRKKFEEWRMIKESLEKAEVEAETICLPSEDLEKVKKALFNVVKGSVEVRELGEGSFKLVVKSKGEEAVRRIFNGFRSRRVLAAARKHLKLHSTESELDFMLNKQAALVNVISIFEEGESPLGGIRVRIKAPNIKKVIDWLTRF